MRTLPGQPEQLDRTSRISQIVLEKVAHIPVLPASGRYNLTISHEKRFLWYRVAKVGTRTILYHLRRHNVALDVEHASFVRYMPKLYSDYFKFAFVRNPWDRLVSCWTEKILGGKGAIFQVPESELARMKDFARFVDWVSTLDLKTCDRHLRWQCELIDLNNLDYLGRLETFAQDFVSICNHLQIQCEEIISRNVSEHRPYADYYTDELREKVLQMYAKDVRMFGYQF
jgi:hypothetical protein